MLININIEVSPMKKRILPIVLTIIFCVGMFTVKPLPAQAATQQQAVNWLYSMHGRQITKYGAQCVALYYEYIESFWGMNWRAVGNIGNAENIALLNRFPSTWKKVTGTPQPGDVAVYSAAQLGNSTGHVAIVVEVHSDTDYYTMDQNSGARCSICGVTDDRAHVHKNKKDQPAMAYIRPNFSADTSGNEVRAQDIGKNFDATISLTHNPTCFVSVGSGFTKGKSDEQIFHFTRNENGTYTIRSKHDGRLLEVTNGENIKGTEVQFAADNEPSTAQQWRIQQVGMSFILAPECAPSLVLELNIPNLRLGTQNGSWVRGIDGRSQLFRITRIVH